MKRKVLEELIIKGKMVIEAKINFIKISFSHVKEGLKRLNWS